MDNERGGKTILMFSLVPNCQMYGRGRTRPRPGRYGLLSERGHDCMTKDYRERTWAAHGIVRTSPWIYRFHNFRHHSRSLIAPLFRFTLYGLGGTLPLFTYIPINAEWLLVTNDLAIIELVTSEKSPCVQSSIYSLVCMWLRDISSWPCLAFLPGPAWL